MHQSIYKHKYLQTNKHLSIHPSIHPDRQADRQTERKTHETYILNVCLYDCCKSNIQ